MPTNFQTVCFTQATITEIEIANAEIATLDIREAQIETLSFMRCIFGGGCVIDALLNKLLFDDCIISNIFRIRIRNVKELGFDNTLVTGKIYFKDFPSCSNALLTHIKNTAEIDDEQLLVLKENFRQLGEYENEDFCHRLYHRRKTQNEPNLFKKISGYILDFSCGYGTKPFRILPGIFVIIFLFAMIFYEVPCIEFNEANSFWDYFYVSGITFFTVGYGDVVPANAPTKMIVILESFLGVGIMSYLIALLSRKIIR